ncbi:MAG: DeoR/GlpR family DNA-binding transcription regulator, partial [Spirochaetia bacterium]
LEMLKRENGLPIQTIADHLGVSHMTVRRDLETMVGRELVRLIHGGVLLNPEMYAVGSGANYSLIAAGSVNAQKKRVIGAKAASLIEPEDTLIIDSGSTTEWIARYLPEAISLTVLSYALNVVTETARRPNCRSVFAGGILHENLLMFESPEGLAQIRRFRATKAFVSAAGVSEEFGVTCANAYERETKRAVMASAAERILVVDSTKFELIKSEYFAGLSEFDTIVTDDGADRSIIRAVKKLGIRLVVA